MSIFFPDNENRRARLAELTTDTSAFLHESADLYREFQVLVDQLDEHIAAAYRGAGLTPPDLVELDILAAARVPIDEVAVLIGVSKILADVEVFVASLAFLAPGALAAGAVTGEAATAGLLAALGIGAGSVLVPLLIGGVIAVGVGMAIDAVTGWQLRDELRHAISAVAPMRSRTHGHLVRARVVVRSMTALKDSWDGLAESGALTPHAVARLTAIAEDLTAGLAAVPRDGLAELDASRHSWVEEDPPRTTNSPPLPLRLTNCYLTAVTAHDPPVVPAGLEPCRVDGGHPVLCHEEFTMWPFRARGGSVELVWFSGTNRIVRRLTRDGLDSVTAITASDDSAVVHLRGGDGTTHDIRWRELAPRGQVPDRTAVTATVV